MLIQLFSQVQFCHTENKPIIGNCLKLEHALQLNKAPGAEKRCTKLFSTCFIKPINHNGSSGDIKLYWTQPTKLKKGFIRMPKALAYFHSENTYKEFSDLCKDSSTDT